MDDLTYTTSMIQEIKELLSGARQRVAVQVNNELLSTYWNIGRIIVEHEQESRERAASVSYTHLDVYKRQLRSYHRQNPLR